MPPPTLPSGTGPPWAELSAENTSDLLHMEAVDVVQVAIPGFGDHGKRPGLQREPAALDRPGDDGIAHQANRVGIGNGDGAFEKAGFLHPGGARHFAVSVLREPAGVNRLRIAAAAGENHGHAGAYGALADDQLAFAADQSGVAYFHAFDIGDCIQRARVAVEWHAERAGARRPIEQSPIRKP